MRFRETIATTIIVCFAAIAMATLVGGIVKEADWAWSRHLGNKQATSKRAPGYDDRIERLLDEGLPAEGSLFVLESDSPGMKAVDRARAQLAFWNRCPLPVRLGTIEDIGNADAILAADGGGIQPKWEKAGLDPDAYSKIGSTGYRGLWIKKKPASGPTIKRSALPPLGELVGFLPIMLAAGCGLLFGGWDGLVLSVCLFSALMAIPPAFKFSPGKMFVVAVSAGVVASVIRLFYPAARKNRRNDLLPDFMAVVLFLFLAFLSLAHALLPPNGLAVVGGKAKLWYLANGIPDGFFTDPVWRMIEPAYPPGLATIVLSCFAFSGGCGNWMIQFAGCGAMALLFALMATVVDGSMLRRSAGCVWLLALFLHPLTLKMGSQLYPEPLMALCIVAAWRRILAPGGRLKPLAWFLLGSAGWFKTEGLVFAGATWIAFFWIDHKWNAISLFAFLAGASLPLVWHAVVRLCGGSFNDIAPFMNADAARGFHALKESVRLAFLEPWRYGFVYPAGVFALPFLFFRAFRRVIGAESRRAIGAAVLFAVLCLLCFALIFAHSRAADFEWHVSTALPRLLWTPALVLGFTILLAFRPVALPTSAVRP